MGSLKLAPPIALIAFLTLGSTKPANPPPKNPPGIIQPPTNPSGGKPHTFAELTVIGDSYAAGGGANGWIQPLKGCMQSDSAYGHWLKAQSDLGVTKLNMQACAGSGAGEVQVCQLGEKPSSYKGPKPDCSNINAKGAGNPGLIVSQFGIDKIGFDQVLKACVYRRSEYSNTTLFGCNDALNATRNALDVLGKSTDIQVTLEKAMAKTGLNDQGQVLALGYPAPFNVDTKDCFFGIYSSNNTEDWSGEKEKHPHLRVEINELIQTLNGIIEKQTKQANGTQDLPQYSVFKDAPTGVNRVHYVNVDDAFGGHRWCDLHEEWFTALYTWQQTAIYLNADEPQFYGGLWHPNFNGQRAISNAIRQTLDLKPQDQATTDKYIKPQQNKDPMEAEPWQQDDKEDAPAEPINPASKPDIAPPPPPPKMDQETLEKILADMNSTDFGDDFGEMEGAWDGGGAWDGDGLGLDGDLDDSGGDISGDDSGDDSDLGDIPSQDDDTQDDTKKPTPKPPAPKKPDPAPAPKKPDPEPAPKEPSPAPPKTNPQPKPDPPPSPPPPSGGPCDKFQKGTPEYEACYDQNPAR